MPFENRITPLRGQESPPDPFANLSNFDAEQQLLGAIMLNNRAYEYVVDLVVPSDFAHPAHGRLFFLIGQLITESRSANPVTLWPIIKSDQVFITNGIDASYLSRLAQSVVTVLNAPDYAKTIGELARRREIVIAAQALIRDAATVDPARSAALVIEDGEQKLFEIAEAATSGGPENIGSVSYAAIRRAEAAYQAGGIVLFETGLVDLDRILRGMAPGEMIVLGARPSMGKSSFAATVALNAAQAGKRSLFFSLEMTKEELAQRWLAGISGITTDQQRLGNIAADEWGRLVEAQQYLATLPIDVDDQPRLSVAQMRQRARRHKRRFGLELIIIDHLQLIRQGGKQENRRLEIGDATSMIKMTAKELGVPILVLSQLNRSVEQREDKRPQLSDLRESGDVEQDSDVVLFLFREEYYVERSNPRRRSATDTEEAYRAREADWNSDMDRVRGLAEIIIAKNRHGRTGTVTAAWSGERQRFENLAV